MRVGIATNFADPRDLARYHAARARGRSESYALSVGDNGVGAPTLGAIDTTSNYGIAVPTSYLRANFGSDPAAWRTARAQITMNGQTLQVPFIDVGPGKGPQSRGVIADLSYPLSQALGGKGWDKIQLSPLANAGVDYTLDPDGWRAEQQGIRSNMMSEAPTPSNPALTDTQLADEIARARAEQALSGNVDFMGTGFGNVS